MIKHIVIGLFMVTVAHASALSQTPFVRVEFDVNGKMSTKNSFCLWVYSGEKVLKIRGIGGRFLVPDEIKKMENMDVRLKVGKFDLSFSGVTSKYFDNKWVIGIDSPPFKVGEVSRKNGKKAILLYYIEYQPEKAEGIRESSIRYEP